jgi:hypothetical protein
MAEFKLDRFKYTWKGDWETGAIYERDDIVRVNGRSYVCVVGHTASDKFETDLNAILPDSDPPQPQPKWIVMTRGKSFLGNWETGNDYNLGDLVLYDGTVWECIVDHTSTQFANATANWTFFAKHIGFIGDWASSTEYNEGGLVKYNGIVYKCVTPHTSVGTIEDDLEKWEVFYDGIEYRGSWVSSTVYRKNDLVRYGGSLFRCIDSHVSGNAFSNTRFEIEAPGFQFAGDWDDTTYYQIGDVVHYGGYMYYATDNNINTEPSRFADDSTISWIVLAETYNFVGDWVPGNAYRTGDVVQRGGYLYVATTDVNESQGPDTGADSTLAYLDSSPWKTLASGKRWRNYWTTSVVYSLGDVIYHLGDTYICNQEHFSDNRNFPGDNGNGLFYWDLLIQSGSPGGLHDAGDMLTYGLSRSIVNDGSTLGPTRVAIGTEDQYLSIDANSEVFWRDFFAQSDTIYVDNNGSNMTGDGTAARPFKTVRHACEYVEDTLAPLTPAKVFVNTGRYKEAGPIAVPAGCVVMGDELRSVTIEATPPNDNYSDTKYLYLFEALDHTTSYIFDLVRNVEVDPTPGNTKTQVVVGFGEGSLAGTSRLVELSDDFKAYITFRLADNDTDPTVSSTNTLISDQGLLNTAEQLLGNKEFIAYEGLAYVRQENPGVTIDEESFIEKMYHFLRAVAYDIQYTGNYKTLLSGRRYVNFALGSQTDDLFWMRDVTGLRNCTIEGLSGSLNPPGVFDLFQRPTGGSCVALDPGWGPDDERVWINTRSPYIQGVTNIGEKCGGMKVDGTLHNGGNKSMVANDFTQVLSDGVGAWVLSDARVELVSVFTYYCQVGYLAESGATIRATNGNNSYGSYGSIATGNNPNEIPQNVTINNRDNEAQVNEAFAGGNSDQLFIFEYEHCGENYTQATAEIIGAGVDASVVYDDFRDGGMFQARLVNTTGSGAEGGSNYLLRRGFAQVTPAAQNSIILSATDLTQFESEIIGMRIIIFAGDGVGQYGYIDGYDVITRTVTVRKESTGELGWDHIIPGTPIQASLDSTCQYSIEPRIETTHPGFDSNSYLFGLSRDIVDLSFGGTTVAYTGIEVDNGTGETFDADPIPAIFRVDRAGPNYTVLVTNPGAGYAVGDEIVILGTDIGGESPANDLTITITEVTDDSTTSIVDFTYAGTPVVGRFVALSNPNYAYYSEDGLDWTQANLTLSDFAKIVAGDNRFIAIPTTGSQIQFSYTAETWVTRALPTSGDWIDAAYGGGSWVILDGSSNNVVYSSDGLTWIASSIPDVAGDSSISQWQSVTYGQGKFIALSGSHDAVAISEDGGATWSATADVLPAQSDSYEFVAVAYGGNRFVGLSSDGKTVYSVDQGETWYAGTTTPNNSGNPLSWKDLKYGDGVFFAMGVQPPGSPGETYGEATNYVVTTEDGLVWYERTLASSQRWGAIEFASLDDVGTWVLIGKEATSNALCHATTGAQVKVRARITAGKFDLLKIWDPGSGYSDSNLPQFTVTDNQFVTEAEFDARIGSGVLAQPSFINRGAGYRSSSSTITIEGDGFADIIPQGNDIVISGVSSVPGPGVQVRITGIEDVNTADPDDLQLFTGISVVDRGDDGSGNGTRKIAVTVIPRIENTDNLAHGTTATLRTQYSQCRISGHDFLDIGTGDFFETNYPELYSGGAYFVSAPENEVLEADGGRVFYTSTDQNGNFRTGELFAVEQATGIVTISAEFFDLDGLSELALGGVRLGGSGAVVREFSTDPTFSEDSNNVVPTQRAIATFLADRLSVGGENLEANNIIAGVVSFGTTDNIINSGGYLYFPTDVTFDGQDALGNPTNVQGTIISQMIYFRDYNDTIQ